MGKDESGRKDLQKTVAFWQDSEFAHRIAFEILTHPVQHEVDIKVPFVPDTVSTLLSFRSTSRRKFPAFAAGAAHCLSN